MSAAERVSERMSERCEQTSERTSKWPSTPSVDFIVVLPNVRWERVREEVSEFHRTTPPPAAISTLLVHAFVKAFSKSEFSKVERVQSRRHTSSENDISENASGVDSSQ